MKLLKAVSSTSPLLYLVKIGFIEDIFKIFQKILIPVEVLEEIERGSKIYPEEVNVLEELIKQGKIKIVKLNSEMESLVQKLEKAIKKLHRGEISAIVLAKQENIEIILVDDKIAYKVSQLYKLKPMRTTALLLYMLGEKKLTFSKFKKLLLKLISTGYYITADVYETLISYAKQISK